MATAAEIVTAIDTAILTFASAGSSSELTIPGVGTKRFASLSELKNLREYYAGLAAAESTAGGSLTPFAMFKLRPGRAT